jgi:uncharacterized membrane protein
VSFSETVDSVGKVVDGVGVGVTVVGMVAATAVLARDLRAPGASADLYRRYRQGVGRAILLGLEFLVAGDIIRTVAVSPTFRSAGVLALIVLIRTFLSMALELELQGRWPWQGRAPAERPAAGPAPGAGR